MAVASSFGKMDMKISYNLIASYNVEIEMNSITVFLIKASISAYNHELTVLL